MKIFILSAASILGVTDAQVYADTLTDYALNDLSAILAAYDVGDYSSDDYSQYSEDYAINYDNYNGDNAYSTEGNEYEEVEPANAEFADYLSSLAGSDEPDTSAGVDMTGDRLRPDKFLINQLTQDAMIEGKLAQGTGGKYNRCRLCNGQTAAACKTSGTEECNDVQDVCEVTVRVARKGAEPLFWSSCKTMKACTENEAENFEGKGKQFDQCKSTSMSARFFHGSTCRFCTKLGDASSKLLFMDENDSNDETKIPADASGTGYVLVSDILASPETYMTSNALYNDQTWY